MDETKNPNIIITDDRDDSGLLYDITDRIFELRDDLSLDIISKNIIDNFNNPVTYETINYVTKFKENYYRIKEENKYDGDLEILNNMFYELAQLILTNLSVKYNVTLGENFDDENVTNFDEYLDKIETLYQFFVVRHYTNIKDYFKVKLLQHKIDFVEKYKNILDDKTYNDIFLNINKKKFHDPSEAIIIYFIDDIVSDIAAEVQSAYDFFKDIANLDLFEDFNNRMNDLLLNFGNDIVILNDTEAVKQYLKMLDQTDIKLTLENDLLTVILGDAILSE